MLFYVHVCIALTCSKTDSIISIFPTLRVTEFLMCNCTAGSLGEASLLLLRMDTTMVPQTGGTLTWSAFLCPITLQQEFLTVLH